MDRLADGEVPDAIPDGVRAIAFYLPQFYPTRENDEWWGPGFTEWTNVVRGTPIFEGHDQPRLPADLGYYDLRVAEVREAQASLAKSHRLEAFAYWHYWTFGRRLLGRPIDEVVASKEPDFRFCLAWANETWERRWHGSGAAHEVLVEQLYSVSDDVAHARWLLPIFQDPRYVRIGSRPLFLIYRPFQLPEPGRTTDILREECRRAGVAEPYLVGMDAHRPGEDTRLLGFDITLNFQPQLGVLPGPNDPGLKIYDYPHATRRMRSAPRDHPCLPCAMVSWDNTPRRGEDGIVFINSTPEAFRDNLRRLVQGLAAHDRSERIVFINAWNEWAEGNHLEPDQRFGMRWLEQVREIMEESSSSEGA